MKLNCSPNPPCVAAWPTSGPPGPQSRICASRGWLTIARTLACLCGIFCTAARGEVTADVPEVGAEGYQVILDLQIPTAANFIWGIPVPYSLNRVTQFPAYDRVAYYLELLPNGGDPLERQWVYVSMEPHTMVTRELGIPQNTQNPVFFSREIRNLNIFSNKPGISTGTGIPTGRVEMWAAATAPANWENIAGASSLTTDWGDTPAAGNYGSFEISRIDTSPQILFSWHGQNSEGQDSIGIGNAPSGNLDWRGANNTSEFSVRRLQILVRPTPHQVALTKWPQHLQFFARDLATNQAMVPVSGSVANTSQAEAAVVVLKRNGAAVRQVEQTLAFQNGAAPFDLSIPLPAERENFELDLFLRSGGALKWVRRAERLAAGDVFIIQGQSNASADVTNPPAASLPDPHVRTWGIGASDSFYLNWFEYVGWKLAVAEWGNRTLFSPIGAWGHQMGLALTQLTGVPVAIFNHALGGQAIGYFQRDDGNPQNPSTNYGRLLYRMERSGLRNSVRGILWYQGENEYGNATVHSAGFGNLRDDWRLDYPAVEKIYGFQLHAGCGVQNTSPATAELRDAQRGYERRFSDFRILSTSSMPGHDGCHYSQAGYQTMGILTASRLAADLYGVGQGDRPPEIRHASLGSVPTQVLLKLADPNVMLSNPSGVTANFQLLGSGGAIVYPIVITPRPGEIELTFQNVVEVGATLCHRGRNSGILPNMTAPGGWGLLVGNYRVHSAAGTPLIEISSSGLPLPGRPVSIHSSVQGTLAPSLITTSQQDQILTTSSNSNTHEFSWTPPFAGLWPFNLTAGLASGLNLEAKAALPVFPAEFPTAGLKLCLTAACGVQSDLRGGLTAWRDALGLLEFHPAQGSPRPLILQELRAHDPAIRFEAGATLRPASGSNLGIGNSDYTLCIRAIISSRQGAQSLLTQASGGNSFLSLTSGSGRIQFLSGAPDWPVSSASTPLHQPVWIITTVNRSTNELAISLGDLEETRLITAGAIPPFPWDFGIGEQLSGEITDIFVYGRVLSGQEIATVKSAASAKLKSPWEHWLAAYPSDKRGIFDDGNGDGVSNGLAFALGFPPDQQVHSIPHPFITPDGVVLTVPGNLPSQWNLQHSTDLLNWEQGSATPPRRIQNEPTAGTVSLLWPMAPTNMPRRYFRCELIKPW